jgi:hypothetical protein
MDKGQKLYEKVIFDFVNAPSFNEGFFTLLENIPAALEFSPKATEKVRAYRPYCILPPEKDREYIKNTAERSEFLFTFIDNVKQIMSTLAAGASLPDLELRTGELPPMSPLEPLLVIYNLRFQPTVELVGNDLVIGKSSLLNETAFVEQLNFDDQGTTALYGLVYCLVKFLEDRENRERLKQCSICDDFFLAKNRARSRCYSPECERLYQREKKQEQRSKDPVKYI